MTVALATLGVVAVAAIQNRLVVGVGLRPRLFVFPALVGLVFGMLLALVRAAGVRERTVREALARREAEVTRLNEGLEERVRQRTAELEEKSEALLRAQQLEVLGRIAGGIAHDFNNVLTAVIGCSAAIREEAQELPPDRSAAIAPVLDELEGSAERARLLARQLLTLARGRAVRPEVVDLRRALAEMVPMLRRLLGETIQLRAVSGDEPATVLVDRTQFEQLVLNLAVNARDAMHGGGALNLSAERQGDKVFLVVADTGAGMNEETRARMFEPFFSTKAPGRGTGLGLAVVSEVARRASATIDVASRPGGGTRVCLTFPASDAAPARHAAATASPPPAAPLLVLLVEDDEAVRNRLAAALEAAGHRVAVAADVPEALQQGILHGSAIDAIVTDVVLPASDGLALVGRLARIGVRAPSVLISGYSADEISRRTGRPGADSILQKPFHPAALLERLAAIAMRRQAG